MSARLGIAAGAVVMTAMACGASGAHAANPFRCEAGALRVAVAGEAGPEPATAGRNAVATVCRPATHVPEKPSNPRRYPTSTLPRVVALNTRWQHPHRSRKSP